MRSINEPSHQKIAETILASVRQWLARPGPSAVVRILLQGRLDETAQRTLDEGLRAQVERVQCVRSFRSDEELSSWSVAFGAPPANVQPRVLRLEQDVLAQGMRLGDFDLAVVVGADHAADAQPGILTNLKRVLRRGGLLLVESSSGASVLWREAFDRAGFDNVRARADGIAANAGGARGLVMGRSDGCVRVRAGALAGPDRTGNASAFDGTGPREPGRMALAAETAPACAQTTPGSGSGLVMSHAQIRERVIAILEQLLQLPPGALDPTSPFSEFGMDSIGGVRFINELNRQLRLELKPTVLFDYASAEKLAAFIADRCAPLPGEAAGGDAFSSGTANLPADPAPASSRSPVPSPDLSRSVPPAEPRAPVRHAGIAVIGMSGRFPGADNIEQFWHNLTAGKDCITEVPLNRWDHSRVYDPGARQPNKTNSKWGGFLTDADKFDPLFFSISGREAEATDPQHRLFLEECYHALEDAGYAGPSATLAEKCGVFAGVEPGDYLHLLLDVRERNESAPLFQGNAESILAARISYFLDLKGPSIAVNTACSSSLVAIHLACQSLEHGECDLALAGGVRVIASEKAYLALGNMGMLSPEGRCKTFDEGADGFVPGEAVGVLVLKPLSAALREGDHIYGVLKGSAINQDGRTNGITAPSSLSQTRVELEAYKKSGINPLSIRYLEAHGTGTKLGDPIEVEALTQAFRHYTTAKGFCAIGSVKTNIGHTMAAAGVCSVIKALLCLQRGKIVPSLNLQKANPYIDFDNSPFFVSTTLQDWPVIPGQPRRAAVSSFGFSGTNSHLVLEEGPIPGTGTHAGEGGTVVKPAYLVAVSAKTPEALQQGLSRLFESLGTAGASASLQDVSFTLNAGRGHFEHRCAMVASSTGELALTLARVLENEKPANSWRSGQRVPDAGETVIFRQLAATLVKELPEAARSDEAVYREKLTGLAALYAKGVDLDMFALHHGEPHRRVALPGYSFARERYWIPGDAAAAGRKRPVEAPPPHLHPLVHQNASTLTEVRFESSFGGQEFFLSGHQIHGDSILPGVAYLEMAIAAVGRAMPGARFGLADVAWMRPLSARQAKNVAIRLAAGADEVGFEILSGDEQTLHARGKARPGLALEPRREDLDAIRERCPATESQDSIYRRCVDAGLEIGDAFRTIREIRFNEHEAFARLEVAESGSSSVDDAFTLHPGLMDGALQTTAVLGPREIAGLPVPFMVGEVSFDQLPARCYAHVRRTLAENGLVGFAVSLLDDAGEVRVELKRLTMRGLRPDAAGGGEQRPVYVRPAWREEPLPVSEPAGLAGRLLLLDSAESSLAGEIMRQAPGLEVVRAFPAHDYSVNGMVAGVRPNCADDFEQLFRLFQPGLVLHRWAAVADGAGDFLERAVFPLFHLTLAAMRQGVNAPVRMLLAYPPGAHPAFGAVAGYARTLRQERPNLRLKVLETERADASQFLAELTNFSDEPDVRVRDGRREIRSLEIFTPQQLAPLPLRPGGVYLISGGLGGLGRIFGRYLAKRYGARLVLLGHSELTPERKEFLTELESLGAEPLYLRADASRRDEVFAALGEAGARFGQIDGVIHAAGVIQDAFLLHKSPDEFAAVVAAKVRGALWLDEATRSEALSFFALFSSVASALGSVGQSDYAYANAFLDRFARFREQQRSCGERQGRTVSINWPLWRNGGMRPAAGFEQLKLTKAGLAALEDETGLVIFETALRCDEPQLIGLAGQPGTIRSLISSPEGPSEPRGDEGAPVPEEAFPPKPEPSDSSRVAARNVDGLRGPVLDYLTARFSTQVKLPAARIRPEDPLEKYGIDSIMVMEFTQQLEQDFGELSKTLLFEHQTLAELAGYFLTNHADRLTELLGVKPPAPTTMDDEAASPEPVASSVSLPAEEAAAPAVPAPRPEVGDEIAIVGVFGRYPMADDLDQFWQNLREGRDSIVEIPRERWDYHLFYDADPAKREPGAPGKTANKWGGFLNEVARFDAKFFSITPREAYAIDPQERLFLEAVWCTLEDAGYRRSALANRNVGVFVGVMYGEYQLYGAGNVAEGWVYPLSSSYASIANRVSYFFNWHGPSMAIDTMCSSSLTAIHLACESLRRGESELAIAGGVNATLHPHKDVLLNPGGFAATDGHCRSFGEGGDGYVPGEGVGAVLLKPLAKAIADGDYIYAIVKSSTVNHDGKTNGYTVPNPKAQAELVFGALSQRGIHPCTINYIEAHGTGTALGDPIEITGLTNAFQKAGGELTLERHSCAIGSVKSNIGHLESAAGIAGVTKVLLQMQHGQIVPSLHSQKLNPNINFDRSIFYVPQALQAWEPVVMAGHQPARRAGVSSFGAGGANAHVILEEFVQDQQSSRQPAVAGESCLVLLSAKTEDRLRARAEQLLNYLQRPLLTRASLRDIAYTLQVGREPLEERLGFVAADVEEARRRLQQFVAGETGPDLQRGSSRESRTDSLLEGDEAGAFVSALVQQKKWRKLAQFWVSGGQVDWDQLYRGSRPVRRVPLPVYPFAGERYWAPDRIIVPKKAGADAWLHPLIHRNVSDFAGQAFVTKLAPDDLIGSAAGHEKLLPGLWMLEMGLAAARFSSGSPLRQVAGLVWSAPLVITEPVTLWTKVLPDSENVRFEVCAHERDGTVLAQGTAVPAGSFSGENLSLETFR
ncbi:MAG: SDR family NAD(P)-dependent oxidoreductase, partial [Verrucomicrobia bacterium]|nr:SDR family NAD(P)-dependent oxidoreductase [Verrucomicrobiota bacterium]